MTICYFGDYDPDYARHKVLIQGLQLNGVTVIQRHTSRKGIHAYFDFFRFLRTLPDDVDAILIGYSDSRFVWFVKLFSSKPIFWNAFYSLYDNWVYDRRLTGEGSLKARWYWFLDWVCCASADRIILEAEADIEYFVRTFNIPRSKFVRVFVGYDEGVMQPLPDKKPSGTFVVEFHGKYIPVQGVEYIIGAAEILRSHSDISFVLIGSGQTYSAVRKKADDLKLANVEFVPRVPFSDIPRFVEDADVCIGLLGTVSRIDQAIPNKVYEASGMRRASITADTTAVRELFSDRENILLAQRGDARDLAEKILELKNNPELKRKIAHGAYEMVRARASFKVLGGELKRAFEIFLSR